MQEKYKISDEEVGEIQDLLRKMSNQEVMKQVVYTAAADDWYIKDIIIVKITVSDQCEPMIRFRTLNDNRHKVKEFSRALSMIEKLDVRDIPTKDRQGEVRIIESIVFDDDQANDVIFRIRSGQCSTE